MGKKVFLLSIKFIAFYSMNYQALCDYQLIKLLVHDPENKEAWSEFCYRFNNLIYSIINTFFKRRDYKDPSIEIEDVVQEVYKKLVKNECKALVVFESQLEYAFRSYLKTITIRVLFNLYESWERVRNIPFRDILYLDDPFKTAITNDIDLRLFDILGIDDNILNDIILEEDIELCLDKIFDGKMKENLYKSIFKLRIYKQLDLEEIASSPLINRKYSTVKNILSSYKPDFIRCLKERRSR